MLHIRMNGIWKSIGILTAVLMLFSFLAAGTLAAQEKSSRSSRSAGSDQIEDVTVILEWIPNTNHTGVFVAERKGWFEEEGLDVEIKRPAQSQTPLMVASGKADFGFAPQEMVTFARAADNPVPVKSIATVNRHNTSGFAAPADRNIDEVADFEGKTYGGWGSEFEEALLQAVMEQAGADFSTVKIVNVGTTDFIGSFRQGIDFRWIFYGWDGVRADIGGMDIDYIPLIEIDPQLDYYTPTLITRTKMIEQDPETVRAFLRAVERGYTWAAHNPDEAADIMLQVNDDLSPEFVHASQRYLSKQYLDENGRWGYMEEKLWRNFGDFLGEYGLLDESFDPEDAYTNEFLPGED